MQADFIRHKSGQPYKQQTGFTLLELLVVVVIVSILFTYTTLAIRSNSPEDLLKEEAHRLERLVQLTLEEAILRGEQYAIEVHLNGYRFLRMIENSWEPIAGDKILREYELPQDMELEMQLEETEINLGLLFDPMSDQKVDLEATDSDEDTDDKKAEPQIFLLSSGEITPEFDIRFYILGIETSYLVKGLFDGSVETKISDL